MKNSVKLLLAIGLLVGTSLACSKGLHINTIWKVVPLTTRVFVITAVPFSTQDVIPPTESLPTPPADSLRRITIDENNQTVDLQVGEVFDLYLGDSFNWTVTVADPSVVGQVMGIMPVRGSQGEFTALRAGTTTLSAIGDPPCRSSKPACAAPSMLFQVKIVVK